eukprot:COSAG04_NODE_2916_length_3388_cov_1.855275_5_plen_112_part_00
MVTKDTSRNGRVQLQRRALGRADRLEESLVQCGLHGAENPRPKPRQHLAGTARLGQHRQDSAKMRGRNGQESVVGHRQPCLLELGQVLRGETGGAVDHAEGSGLVGRRQLL